MTEIIKFIVFASILSLSVGALAQDEEPVTYDGAAEERLLQEFARYRRLLHEGTLDEADIAAKRVVEMTIQVYGPNSRETASALNNLGIVQHGSGQFDAAIQNFTRSVEIIEDVEDRLHAALVNPLKGLGAAQLGGGRPDKASKTFTRAAHITQVNDGPHNLGQVEILDSLAEAQLQLGNTKKAFLILDRIHIINVKFFEKNPLGLIPTLLSRASWQHRAGFYNEERSTYRRAIRIIEAGPGKNDPMLIEPLLRLGGSFYFVDTAVALPKQYGLVTHGEVYFKRAVRLAEKSDDSDWRVLARVKIALADYYTFSDSKNRARKIYVKMWDFLSTDEERINFRDSWFKDPVPIIQNRLPKYAGQEASSRPVGDEFLTGQVTVNYRVTNRGRVKNLRTEATPPEFTNIQRMVHREIRHRVFRPRIDATGPVSTDDLIFEHTFSYLQADLDALREAIADKKSTKAR